MRYHLIFDRPGFSLDWEKIYYIFYLNLDTNHTLAHLNFCECLTEELHTMMRWCFIEKCHLPFSVQSQSKPQYFTTNHSTTTLSLFPAMTLQRPALSSENAQANKRNNTLGIFVLMSAWFARLSEPQTAKSSTLCISNIWNGNSLELCLKPNLSPCTLPLSLSEFTKDCVSWNANVIQWKMQ